MKKIDQIAMNDKVLEAMHDFEKVSDIATLNSTPWKRLRSCTAHVAHVGNYYVLMSYNTVVAIIDTRTDTLYDFLRYVYRYTSTSAQHIAKFAQDYGAGKWGCAERYTYKEVAQ